MKEFILFSLFIFYESQVSLFAVNTVLKMQEKPVLLNKIRWCLKVFAILGFSLKITWFTIFRSFLLIVILMKLFANGCEFLIGKLDTVLNISLFIRSVQTVGSISRGLVPIIQLTFNVKKLNGFLEKIAEIDKMISAIHKIDYQLIQWRLSLNLVLSLIIYSIYNLIIIYKYAMMGATQFRYISPLYLPVIISQITSQLFIFMVQLLQSYVVELTKVLQKIVDHQEVLVGRDIIKNWRYKMRENHLSIVKLGKIYKKLWEASNLLNESFDFTLLVHLMNIFIVILYLTSMTLWESTKAYLYGIFMNFTMLFLLHLQVNYCLNDVGKGFYVHQHS